jgi:hypothetical protein
MVRMDDHEQGSEMKVPVTAQIGMKMLRDNGGRFLVVSKELCYGRAETLEDAEKGARVWRYNFER